MSKFTEALSLRFWRNPDEAAVRSRTSHEVALWCMQEQGVLDAAEQSMNRLREERGEHEVTYPHFELVPGEQDYGPLATLSIRCNPRAIRFRTSPEIIAGWMSSKTKIELFNDAVLISPSIANGDEDQVRVGLFGYADANLRRDAIAAELSAALTISVMVSDMRMGVHPSRLEGSSEGDSRAQKIISVDTIRGKIHRLQPQLSAPRLMISGS